MFLSWNLFSPRQLSRFCEKKFGFFPPFSLAASLWCHFGKFFYFLSARQFIISRIQNIEQADEKTAGPPNPTGEEANLGVTATVLVTQSVEFVTVFIFPHVHHD